METRREVIKMTAAQTALIATTGMAGNTLSTSTSTSTSTSNANAGLLKPLGERAWLAALGTSLANGHDCQPRVEGTIPVALRGTLYRNGPGLFDQGGARKSNVLDGDGMIRALTIDSGSVRFRNKYIETPKYLEEEQEGRFSHSAWTTRRPGGVLANIGGGGMLSQAGITVYAVGKKVIAIYEVGLPFEIDPDTLATIGTYQVGEPGKASAYKAHTKFDGKTGEWVLSGTEYGPNMKLHVIVHRPDGTLKKHFAVQAPRQTYVHDFFASENYILFNLHPVELSLMSFLAGFKSLTDGFSWNRKQPNLVMIVRRDGTGEPVVLEAPGAFMWHALNAYERGGDIIADFVGYDEPDHFIGENAEFTTVMDGKAGEGRFPGTVRRYVINLAAKTLREELINDQHHEFPTLAAGFECHPHKEGFIATGKPGDFFNLSGLVRQNTDTGARDEFDYGPKTFVYEPLHAADPTGASNGWVLQEGLDGATGKSFYGIFDARRIADGPLAKVLLDHHLPLSFHGDWRPASVDG